MNWLEESGGDLSPYERILLSSVVARELEQVSADTVSIAFQPTTPGFRGLNDRFLADRERLLKGGLRVGDLVVAQGLVPPSQPASPWAACVPKLCTQCIGTHAW